MFKKWLRENHLMLESNNWRFVPKRAQVLFVAECVNKALPIYEQEYPNDNRPRKAVEAAFEYALTDKLISQNIIDAAYYSYDTSDGDVAAGVALAAAHATNIAYSAFTYAAIPLASQATGLNFDKLQQKVIGKIQFNENWKTTHTLGIAKKIWETRELGNLPILADALIDAGCDMYLVNYMISNEEQTLADFFLWNLNLG